MELERYTLLRMLAMAEVGTAEDKKVPEGQMPLFSLATDAYSLVRTRLAMHPLMHPAFRIEQQAPPIDSGTLDNR